MHLTRGHTGVATAALVLVAALAATPSAAAPHAGDPPRIVPWHLIGNVGFGMTHERVERMYGRAINGNPPRDTIVWQYRGRGVISVIYDERGYVDDISTSSSAGRRFAATATPRRSSGPTTPATPAAGSDSSPRTPRSGSGISG